MPITPEGTLNRQSSAIVIAKKQRGTIFIGITTGKDAGVLAVKDDEESNPFFYLTLSSISSVG